MLKAVKDESYILSVWRNYHTGKSNGDGLGYKNQIINHYKRLVEIIANSFAARLPDYVDREDITSEGMLGLIDAVEKFDLNRGYKFETYASPRIRGAILDYLRNKDFVPKLARSRTRCLQDITNTFYAENGRNPSDEELKKILARKKFKHSEQYLSERDHFFQIFNLSSLEERMNKRNSFFLRKLKYEPAYKQTPADIFDRKASRDFLNKELTPEEQLTMILYYVEGLTMKEIGSVIGVTPSRISQIHTNMIEKIRSKHPKAEILEIFKI